MGEHYVDFREIILFKYKKSWYLQPKKKNAKITRKKKKVDWLLNLLNLL